MTTSTSPPPLVQQHTWWRRNRWALLALPFVLVLALAAGSSRLHDYWWMRGFHEPAPVTGGVASLVDEYDDGFLQYPIEARYSVASFAAADVTLFNGDPLPAGVRAWQIRLHVEADPDMALSGCQVQIVDTDGNEHGQASALSIDGPQFEDCVPRDRPGPQAGFGSTEPPKLAEGYDPRPAEYDTNTVIVMPQELTPASVRLWYYLPKYVELPLDVSVG